MSLTEYLTNYGYLTVFIGSLLEGETVLTLAGYFTHQGYLSFTLTVMVAAIGGTLGDQLFFLLGRYYGHHLLARFPKIIPKVDRASRLIEKYNAGLIISVRFMYGLRIAGPIAIGMSEVPIRRFILFNCIGAMIWAVTIVSIGYLFGQSLEWLFDGVKHYQALALLLLMTVIVIVGMVRYWRNRYKV